MGIERESSVVRANDESSTHFRDLSAEKIFVQSRPAMPNHRPGDSWLLVIVMLTYFSNDSFVFALWTICVAEVIQWLNKYLFNI